LQAPSGATYFKTLVYSLDLWYNGIDVYSVSSPASTSSGVSSFEGVYVAQYLLADIKRYRLMKEF